ncbi:hypothetical protein Tco_0579298 [Tanacetum coccineum]
MRRFIVNLVFPLLSPSKREGVGASACMLVGGLLLVSLSEICDSQQKSGEVFACVIAALDVTLDVWGEFCSVGLYGGDSRFFGTADRSIGWIPLSLLKLVFGSGLSLFLLSSMDQISVLGSDFFREQRFSRRFSLA